MNEEQQALLTQGLKEILSWMETARDLAIEQTPHVVQEILRWGIASALLDVGAGLGFLIFAWKLFQYVRTPITWKHWHDDTESKTSSRFSKWSSGGNEELCVASCFAGIVTGFLGPVFFLGGLIQGLKVLVAPRLYVLSQLQKLVE